MMNYKNFAHLSFLVFKYLFENFNSIKWIPSNELEIKNHEYEALNFSIHEYVHFLSDEIMITHNKDKKYAYDFYILEQNEWKLGSLARYTKDSTVINKLDLSKDDDSDSGMGTEIVQYIFEYDKKKDIIHFKIIEIDGELKNHYFNYPFTECDYFNILLMSPDIDCDYETINDILNYDLPDNHYLAIYNF